MYIKVFPIIYPRTQLFFNLAGGGVDGRHLWPEESKVKPLMEGKEDKGRLGHTRMDTPPPPSTSAWIKTYIRYWRQGTNKAGFWKDVR